MKTKLIAALLVAASATIAAPAFASGYGPAPFYRPGVGAPAWHQRGVVAVGSPSVCPSARTVRQQVIPAARPL
jgi:hypothetical protein